MKVCQGGKSVVVKIVAMGDNVVDCYLSQDMMFPGGNCLNLAVFISRYGGEAAYIGAIGCDKAGETILRALEEEGVDKTHLRLLEGKTAYCLIAHQKHERIFISFDLGVSMFEPSIQDFNFIAGADCVHIGQSSGLDMHLNRVQTLTALSYDFSDKYDAQKISRIAPFCLLASLSAQEESRDYAQDLVRFTLASGARYALVTRGAKGAILGYGQDFFEVEAVKTDLVDTLGAGDCFIARVLFGLIKQEAPLQFLQAAAIEAARVCRHYGAFGYSVPLDPTITSFKECKL